jgi:hypothetical protein
LPQQVQAPQITVFRFFNEADIHISEWIGGCVRAPRRKKELM